MSSVEGYQQCVTLMMARVQGARTKNMTAMAHQASRAVLHAGQVGRHSGYFFLGAALTPQAADSRSLMQGAFTSVLFLGAGFRQCQQVSARARLLLSSSFPLSGCMQQARAETTGRCGGLGRPLNRVLKCMADQQWEAGHSASVPTACTLSRMPPADPPIHPLTPLTPSGNNTRRGRGSPRQRRKQQPM